MGHRSRKARGGDSKAKASSISETFGAGFGNPAPQWRHPSATHFALYLSKQTWLGDAGDRLADEVRSAGAAGLPIVMVHSTPDNDDGCEFGEFFKTTHEDLIQAGLYTALALPFHTGPFRHVASCMIARAIGATQLKLEPKNKLKKATSVTTIATTTVAAQKC